MVSCCISNQALKQVSRLDQIDQMESNGLHLTNPGQMASCWLSTQALKQVSRMDQIDQIESNGLHSTKPGQMVKWRLVA